MNTIEDHDLHRTLSLMSESARAIGNLKYNSYISTDAFLHEIFRFKEVIIQTENNIFPASHSP